MRVLPIVGELVSLIQRRVQERVDGCQYIFHRHGQFIRSFRKAWLKATERAGCSGRVFHALRRSAARDKLRSGTHETIIMRAQGWKTRSMFDRYNITSERDIE